MAHAYDEHLASNRYHDRNFGLEAAKILPGEYFVSESGMLLVTVLGSCVAACIRDTDAGVGGMNHFMLPDDGGRETVGSSARYGTYAMEVLINHLLKMGARRNRLEAKVFGGGAVLASLSSSNVGVRNAEFVLNYLKTEKIPVVAKDLLDSYPRKVYYFPQTGRVLVKKLHRVHNETLFSRERDYKERLSSAKVEGDIELFI
ncbi:chemoreceptor glutamine deamidase CheD [Dechloromonas denitrificans]|uniref:chemoreceptor glutamine deamidase CheD n=1 Tax=Azonexaceae TaxID=2008795 RepID=UPI001CF8AC4C|nr:chemoreceptor glutamine deamidase CheD [Dechloromonas denitrificans]UCV04523.1 chemoreceptor glutamine deamidase CheD [Dechloromonas denitrificans]UCV08853.1 chemoreceptor glutamine deamidase CheD [Dechloromonas denitrificans]